jgi:2-succinyl-5-enolpyruvyl-6-hydroxy-3-cyclohexene-1-carboxylate synthase
VNPSTAQGLVIVDELVRCGVTDVVLAPGSRNAPLALALAAADAAGRLRLHVRVDERSAGYLALGLALVSRRTTAVVTTSGTAVANLLPAVTEASYAAVPLIALTADRPPELRGIGANQAIDQVRIFGTAVRWACDLGVAEERAGQVAYWRSVIDRALDTTIEDSDPGPVHVNVPLRAPLVPDDDGDWLEPLELIAADLDADDLPELLPRTVDGRLSLSAAQPLDEVLAPFVAGADDGLADLLRIVTDIDLSDDLDELGDLGDDADDEDEDEDFDEVEGGPGGERGGADGGVVPARGVVVVGHTADAEQGDAAIALAEACGWPLIGEPSGNARSGDTTLTHGPLLLADNEFFDQHLPDVAVVVGTAGLERSVLRLIARTPLVVGVDARAALRRPDPTSSVTVHVAEVPEAPEDYEAYDDSWLDSWLAADARARAAVERTLDAAEGLTGPDVARTVWDLLGPDNLLLAAASWPVRHLGTFARVRDGGDAPLVVGNRGASGIDGLVSTAWGAALAHQGGTSSLVEDEDGMLSVVTTEGGTAYALLGDLAFLHDHGGLVVGPDEPRPDLVYVVVDNDGGGIFSQLEQAAAPHFDRVFGTPHGLDLVAVARAAGATAHRVQDVASLVRALDAATATGGVHVVVARVGDRASEAALLARVQAAVSAELAAAADDAV